VAIADGLVYAADTPGRVHCLDAETGQCYWGYECRSDIWTSPLAVDGKVFVGTGKGLCVLAAGKRCELLASIRLGSPVRAMAVAANGTLFVASQRYLWAVSDPNLSHSATLAKANPSGHPAAIPTAKAAAQPTRKRTL
jgi:outer membrane protein assembly factor BamB